MPTPRPYQETGRDFLASRRFALLADEMRVGKTPQAILAAEKVLAQKTLVVCPAIAVPQWQAEYWRWWPQAGVAPVVVSYDRLRLNADGILSEKWDLAIADECHFAKNPEAQRTKLIYGKGGLGWAARRLWVLSGTPAPKHAGELWPMLFAFGATKLRYSEFLARYCTFNKNTLRYDGTRMERVPELREILAKVMLRRTRKQVAPDMPAIDFSFLSVEPVSQADLKIPAGLSDQEVLDWIERHPTADREDRIEVARAKALCLAEEVAFAINNGLLKQTVVFGWHIEPLQVLAAALRQRGVSVGVITGQTNQSERVRVQTEFRLGGHQVVVANILAAGTAIDLSSASHAYMLELDWVPANNVQAVNRLVSMDKKESVTVDVATWPGSVDDRVQKVLLRRVKELSTIY